MKQETPVTPKEKRMAKAVRLHYMEDMNYKQIAEELGVKHSTIKKYFSDDQIQSLKRHFSDKQIYDLQRSVEQQVKDAEDIAYECVSNAKQLAESSRAYNKTAKTALSIPEKKIKMLQELGVLQKPKERKEVTKTETGLEDKLAEAYQELELETEETSDEEKELVE